MYKCPETFLRLHTDLDSLKMIPILVDWFTRQISTILRCKRISILECKPGAASTATKVIFVHMLRRVGKFGDKVSAINALQAKFNDALNDSASKINQFILTINSCNQYEHFNHKGGLSECGRELYFQEIDDLLHRFDRDNIKLLPNPKNKPRGKHNRSALLATSQFYNTSLNHFPRHDPLHTMERDRHQNRCPNYIFTRHHTDKHQYQYWLFSIFPWGL